MLSCGFGEFLKAISPGKTSNGEINRAHNGGERLLFQVCQLLHKLNTHCIVGSARSPHYIGREEGSVGTPRMPQTREIVKVEKLDDCGEFSSHFIKHCHH